MMIMIIRDNQLSAICWRMEMVPLLVVMVSEENKVTHWEKVICWWL
jgi:hypothetical protein